MPVIKLDIMEKHDPALWPELQDPSHGGVVHLPDSVWQVALLKGGMLSGKSSVLLRLDLPDGRTVLAETSLAAWRTVTAGMAGVEE